MVLTAFSGQVLGADDVADAFTERSRTLVSPEFVTSYVGIKADPRPNVTPSNLFFGGADIPCLSADICPYFVTL